MFQLHDYLSCLETLVNLDSGSNSPEKICAVADLLCQWFDDLGWTITRHDLGPQTGPLLEISNGSQDHYDAVLLGHMDTVFPDGDAARRPFRTEGNRAYGPGVADMKNGDVAMLFIARELAAMGDRQPSVCMLFNPDEELGSCYSAEKMIEIMTKSSRLFVMESAIHYRHCHSRRGRLAFDVRFTGQAAHAGHMLLRSGASAILEAAKWTEEICGMVNAAAGISANVGRIEGGLARNIVPADAMLSAEIRTDRRIDIERLHERLQQMAASPFVPGVQVRLENVTLKQPLEPGEATLAYLDTVRSVAAELGQNFETGCYPV